MAHINFVERLNAFYQSKGFPPYRWSVYDTTPWTPLAKPLKKCKVALIASGGVSRKDQRPFEPLAQNDLTLLEIPKDTPVSDLVVNHGYYDHTDADKDVNCVFPIERLRELAEEGYIGEFARTIYSGFMGRIYNRSKVSEEMAPALAARMKEEGVDAVLLVPAGPIEHQTISLVARAIEEAGLSTVTMTSARDMTAQVKPPRAVFVDFPLGHQTGKPQDRETQMYIIKTALGLLETADEPGTLLDLPLEWDGAWPDMGF